MFLITKKHELEEAEMFPDFLVRRLIAGRSEKWVFDAIIEHLTRFNKPEDRDIDGDFHLGFSKDLKKNEMFDLIEEFIDEYFS